MTSDQPTKTTVERRYKEMEEALTDIMNDPRAGAWAEMRARCGLAVDL